MKTIALFGAATGTGLQFINIALEEGYRIRALVHDPLKIKIKHTNLILIKGDASNAEDVKKTMKGARVVVSLLCHLSGTFEWMQSEGTRNIVKIMKRYNITRLITTSGGGLILPKVDKPRFSHYAMNIFLKIAAPKIYFDAVKHREIIVKSGLEWVIVRRPIITDEPEKGYYKTGYINDFSTLKIGREDLANFLVRQIENNEFIKQMPYISY